MLDGITCRKYDLLGAETIAYIDSVRGIATRFVTMLLGETPKGDPIGTIVSVSIILLLMMIFKVVVNHHVLFLLTREERRDIFFDGEVPRFSPLSILGIPINARNFMGFFATLLATLYAELGRDLLVLLDYIL